MVIALLCCEAAGGQTANTSPPPVQVVLVANLHAHTITKHPALPLLYLTLNSAPESKNLVTIRLAADGSLLDGGQKAWPDYLSTDPTNQNFRYAIPRPIMLAEERILYLAAAPFDPRVYNAVTNNNEIAVIGLDEHGEPAKRVAAFRTTNPGNGILSMGWDPLARRLFFSYQINGWFGWCQMDRAGLPVSNQTHFLTLLNSFWSFVYQPEWGRFYGSRANAFDIIKLSEDGSNEAFVQYFPRDTVRLDNVEVSRKFLKLYMLDGSITQQLRVYPLTREGRLTGLPRFFPLAPGTTLIRFDFKAGLLYAFSEKGRLELRRLDSAGYPTGPSQVSQLSGNGVRDAIADEETGKVYVACTNEVTVR